MLHVIWFQAVSQNSLKVFECLCGRDGMQFCTNPEQQKWPTLVHYLDSAVADGWRQTGSVQSPPSGGLTIPTLPCGLWCHARLCLWMAMCSSPLISNRWWETSKWWFFAKTSSQNKVKGTQKNSKRSHEKNKTKQIYTFLIAAGCAEGRVTLCALLHCWEF